MDSMEELTALRIQETVEDGMEQMMMTGMMRMMANTEKIVQKIERIEIIVANMMKKTIGNTEEIMVVEAVEIIEAMMKEMVMEHTTKNMVAICLDNMLKIGLGEEAEDSSSTMKMKEEDIGEGHMQMRAPTSDAEADKTNTLPT